MVTWREVRDMLDVCLPGRWKFKESLEYYTIYVEGFKVPYPGLTRGSHRQRGKGSAEIYSIHVRKMAKTFNILNCAVKQLPIVGPPMSEEKPAEPRTK